MLSLISEETVVHSQQPACDILVVEDNTAVRQVLREVLHEEGYRVHAVIHGQDALDYLSATPTLPRVILLDLMMPIMTGWEFRALQRNRDDLCNIPVIVLSAVASDVLQEQFTCLDAVALLTKPINWTKLLNIIAQILPNSDAAVQIVANDMPLEQHQMHNFAPIQVEPSLAVQMIGIAA